MEEVHEIGMNINEDDKALLRNAPTDAILKYFAFPSEGFDIKKAVHGFDEKRWMRSDIFPDCNKDLYYPKLVQYALDKASKRL